MVVLSEGITQVAIPLAALVGIGFVLLQWLLVSRMKLTTNTDSSNGCNDRLIEEEEEEGLNNLDASIKCAEIQNAISVGAASFLLTQYSYLAIFMVVFGAIIFLFLGSVKGFSTESEPCVYNKGNVCKPALAKAIFSMLAFLLGALTSVLSGFLGMKIATYASARTTLQARKGVGKAFITAMEMIGKD